MHQWWSKSQVSVCWAHPEMPQNINRVMLWIIYYVTEKIDEVGVVKTIKFGGRGRMSRWSKCRRVLEAGWAFIATTHPSGQFTRLLVIIDSWPTFNWSQFLTNPQHGKPQIFNDTFRHFWRNPFSNLHQGSEEKYQTYVFFFGWSGRQLGLIFLGVILRLSTKQTLFRAL